MTDQHGNWLTSLLSEYEINCHGSYIDPIFLSYILHYTPVRVWFERHISKRIGIKKKMIVTMRARVTQHITHFMSVMWGYYSKCSVCIIPIKYFLLLVIFATLPRGWTPSRLFAGAPVPTHRGSGTSCQPTGADLPFGLTGDRTTPVSILVPSSISFPSSGNQTLSNFRVQCKGNLAQAMIEICVLPSISWTVAWLCCTSCPPDRRGYCLEQPWWGQSSWLQLRLV